MRAALRLVWSLDVKHLTAHRTRLALSAFGIAVGVALAVAVGSLSSSITSSLEAIAQATASKATLEVRPNGRTGIAPEVLERVQKLPGVKIAGGVVESYVHLRNGPRDIRVLAVGVDSGTIAMSPRATANRRFKVVNPFGLYLPSSVADELHTHAGQNVRITTPGGFKPVPVGAVLPADRSDRTRLVVGPVGVMQQLLGRGETYDAIYIEARDPDATLPRLKRAIGPLALAGPIAFRSDQIEQLLASANASLQVGTMVALFVGAFLVFNTMSMAAVERLREAALLRAVGAKRRQVFALFITEGALLGLIGSAIGLGLGLVLAKQLLSARGTGLQEIFPVQITSLEISPRVLAAAGIAGVVAATVAAFLPARRIARADPAPALGATGSLEDPTRRPRRAVTMIGTALAVIGPAITVPSMKSGVQAGGLALGGMVLTLAGIALLIPTVVPLVARVLLRPFSNGRGLVRLASGEVLRSPGRTAFTTGAVLLSLALVVGFSIAQASFTRAFDVSFRDNILAADLYVRSATWQIFGSDVPMDEGLATQVENMPGVRAAWPFKLTPATFEGRSAIILAYDLKRFAYNSRLSREGKQAAIAQYRATRGPNDVIASTSLLRQRGYKVGDTIRLSTPTGAHKLRISEKFEDPSAVSPELIFDYEAYKQIWGTGGADTLGVVAKDEGAIEDVRRAITDRFGRRLGVHVDTRAQYQALLSRAINSIQQLIGSVQFVAVIVAALGLANTLLISTFERRRDLGVLRAIGMMRKQLRRMIATEAVLIGLLGVVMAWGLGTLIGAAMFGFIQGALGMSLPLVIPPAAYVGAAILGIVAALAASLYPAARAARLDVVEALQYE